MKKRGLLIFFILFGLLPEREAEARTSDAKIEAARTAISKQQIKDAVNILKPLVKNEDPQALNLYAILCMKKQIPRCSVRDVESMLLKSSELGERVAQYNLALLYLQGHGIKKSQFKAQRWLKKSANSGYFAAQYNLGKLHLSGLGVRRDTKKGWELIKLAAKQGLAPAQYDLANTFFGSPIKLPRSYREDLDISKKEATNFMMLAAKSGYPFAQLGYGEIILNTEGKTDIAKAQFWINAAIRSGIPVIWERAKTLNKRIKELKSDRAIASARKSLNNWLSVKENRDAALLGGLVLFMYAAGEAAQVADCHNPDVNFLSSENAYDCENRIRMGGPDLGGLFMSK